MKWAVQFIKKSENSAWPSAGCAEPECRPRDMLSAGARSRIKASISLCEKGRGCSEGLGYQVERNDSLSRRGHLHGGGYYIESIVTTDANRKSISKSLSLGSRPDGADDPGHDAKHSETTCVAVLTLCQRVYYSGDTWAKCSVAYGNTETVGLSPTNDLPADWKTISLNHWQTKSETDIIQGIRMFDIVPTARAIDIQQAAYAG